MALPYHGMSLEYAQAIEWADLTFAGCFVAEVIVKMVGLGTKGYFLVGAWSTDAAVEAAAEAA
jgi:hypothetical protein